MTNEKLQEDIAWIKQLAESGSNTPLSGNPIGVWWAALSSAMMLIHWAVLTERLPFSIEYIGFGWLTYSLIGFAGTMVLSKRLKATSTSNSIGSRVASATWAMVGAGITTFAIGAVIAVFITGIPYWIFNAILPVAFIGYGIANGATAILAKNRISALASVLSFAVTLALMPFLMSATLYLIAAIAVLIVILPPSLLPTTKA